MGYRYGEESRVIYMGYQVRIRVRVLGTGIDMFRITRFMVMVTMTFMIMTAFQVGNDEKHMDRLGFEFR